MVNKKQLAIDFANSLNRHEIEKIILFGSVARGEDTKDSDIDILIITNNKSKIIDDVYSKVGKIILELDEYLSVKIIRKNNYEQVKNSHIMTSIEKEGILI
ncbi:putative nucleotidyltransferase [Methanobrevibacter arboriphilus JCM 13429 = DSM 1125]|uniref:protein adenylyltransferase n=1 Tax=Methanobrevibacter arboriphilus JCM 13429 = DSM 1125 TaxID=1300164 RepID=A0A1V6N0B0_METAZ|nr:nucleotidyltransferase domain-containing protein [Methanobrevibacter arboriphilus]OQD58003.1 putative nucleotidyltransferase [Methanobrevibacter arboriphilus JCM 13429 = DSM 1125]